MLPTVPLRHDYGQIISSTQHDVPHLSSATLIHRSFNGQYRARSRPNWVKLHPVRSALSAPPSQQLSKGGAGHIALQNGLGEVGDVAPALMPWLLRLSHIR